jgi:integrase
VKKKLTVRSVEQVPAATNDVILWDDKVPGFGLKVTPTGRRVFFLYFRTSDGQQRRPTIGIFPDISPEKARNIALAWRVQVNDGKDPSAEKQDRRDAPTVSVLCEKYMAEHAIRKKASSRKADQRLIDKHVLPALGRRKVADVKRSHVSSLQHSLAPTPYEANRVLALLSKMFSLSERWGFRPDGSNPARNVERYREVGRERYLSRDEFARLWGALSAAPQTNAVTAIKLLVLTGRRLSEVLTLQWKWIDLDAGALSLPDTKNGALHLPLATGALALLSELRGRAESDDVHVFPSRVGGQSLSTIQKPWRRIRALAELEDVRLHDLRHSFASVAAGAGLSLPMIGKLLGHTQASTTQRYAHLANSPVRAAVDLIDDALTAATRPNIIAKNGGMAA